MTRRLSFFVAVISGVVIGSGALYGCGSEESANPNDQFLDDGGGGGSGGNRFNDASGGQSGGNGSTIGSRCLEDADCAGGNLVCLREAGDDFAGGGPAGGICTVDCSAEGPPACADVHPEARCVLVDDSGTASRDDDVAYCFPGCTLGDPTAGEAKCLDRPDLACFESSTPGAGFCQPACNGDFDCSGGRVCDFALGVCVDAEMQSELLPIGAECDTESTTRQCAGVCLQFDDDYAACSGFCRLGELGCGSDLDSTDPFEALCALSVGDPDLYGTGDAGFCLELCDCDDQCGHPDAVCDAFPEDLALSLGRLGLCVPLLFSTNPEAGVGIPCNGSPDAGGGGTPEAGPDGAAASDAGSD